MRTDRAGLISVLARAVRLVSLLVLLPVAEAAGQVKPIAVNEMRLEAAGSLIQMILNAAPPADVAESLTRSPVTGGWLVMSTERTTGATRTLEVSGVTLEGFRLQLAINTANVPREWLDPATHIVSVTSLRSALFPRAVTGEPPDTGSVSPRRFGAAATAQAADVYFSGKVTATDGSKPKYAFEARLRNQWYLGANRGAIGYQAEMAAEDQTNADPDRIAIGALYRRVLDSRGLILQVQPIAGEFARAAPRTTTLLTTAQVEYVLVPTTGLPKSKARWAMVVLGGIEAGNNLSNAIDKENGSGGVARIRVAANPYVVLKPGLGFFKNLKASVFWDVRFLMNEEIDPGRLDSAKQPTLTKRTRQHVKADFDIGLNDFVSLTLQHRQGYLPPLYKKVNSTIGLSLTFKGRWL